MSPQNHKEQLGKYKEYPYLIYEPYSKTLDEKDSQRKDHQRICLEMILAYNASVCLANYYHYKTAEEGNDAKIGADLPKLDFDLGMMSIGKWNQVTRDSAKVLFDATSKGKNNDFLAGDIGSNYQKTSSLWNKNIKKPRKVARLKSGNRIGQMA